MVIPIMIHIITVTIQDIILIIIQDQIIFQGSEAILAAEILPEPVMLLHQIQLPE